MKLKNVIEGLIIFSKYYKEGDQSYTVYAEHDEIMMDSTDKCISS